MKKAILLLVAFVGIVACGKDDANGTEGGDISTARFLPPKWIQGSWTTNNKQFGYALLIRLAIKSVPLNKFLYSKKKEVTR